MSQNTENIEARLCDYIEGQLDEPGRVEIEKHLQDNPQHRQLLLDLMRTRALVQALPRESAPPEILESLQSQLERSVLLGAEDEEAAPLKLHVRRLPQFGAIAAMLLLAVGLGAVIYFMLPPANVRQPPVVIAVRPESSDLSRAVLSEPMPARTLAPAAGSREDEVFTLSQNLPPLPASMLWRHGPGGGLGFAGHSGLAPNRLVVVVMTTDSRAANSDVAEFLSGNRIRFQPLEQSMPAPLEMRQVADAMAARDSRRNAALRVAAGAPARQEWYEVRSAIPSPKESQEPVLSGKLSRERDSEGLADAAALPQAKPDAFASVDQAERIIVPPLDDFALDARQLPPVESPPSQSQQVIVASNMTKRQAAQLSDELSKRRAGQKAEMIDQPIAPSAALPVAAAAAAAQSGATSAPSTAAAENESAMPHGADADESLDVVIVVQEVDAGELEPATRPIDSDDLHLRPTAP